MGTKEFSEYYKNKNVSGTYDDQREGTAYRRNKRSKELDLFLNLLNKKKGEKVLELGCSSGFLTKHLGKVTAIDTNKDMLEITKGKNPKATVKEASMFELPFEDESFDKVVTMRVWTHLNEKELRDGLQEAKRVLKDNGRLVFDVEEHSYLRIFVHFFYKRIFGITGYKIYPYRLRKLRRIVWEEGFEIEKVMFLKHRIGRQIMLRAKLELERTNG